MNVITIPKKLASRSDLVVISRHEYEALIGLKKQREFNPTAAQRKALKAAEANIRKGKTLPYHELLKGLGSRN